MALSTALVSNAATGNVQPLIRDLMNPRPSNTPSEDHSRGATVRAAGFLAREIREIPETRST